MGKQEIQKKSWYDYINSHGIIEREYNIVARCIYEAMAELGESHFDCNLEFETEYDDNFNRKEIFIKAIDLENRLYSVDLILDLSHNVKVATSDGRQIRIDQMTPSQLWRTSRVIDVIEREHFMRKLRNKEFRIHVENKDVIITDPCYIKHSIDTKSNQRNYIHRDDDETFAKEHGWVDKDTILTPKQYLDIYNHYRCKPKRDYFDEVKEREEAFIGWEDEMDYVFRSGGVDNYIAARNLYGDWSCTVYDSDTKERLGSFCADAGMVGVFELDQVLKHDPRFGEDELKKGWVVARINGFTGDIWLELVETEGVYEEDTEYHKKGDKWHDQEVKVIGRGNINFESSQTGL